MTQYKNPPRNDPWGIDAILLLLFLKSRALCRLDSLSGGGVENDLTESDRLRSNLDELLVGDELNSLLEGKLNGCDESKLLVRAGGTDSGEVLFLTYVDLDVVRFGILADDHTLIYGSRRADEERSAILSLIETVGGGDTLLAGNEGGGESGLDLASEGLISCEDGGDKTLAAGIGKKLATVTEQASGGNVVEELLSCAVELHIDESTLSRAKLFHYGADVLLGNVNDNVLDRLTSDTVDLLVEDSGVRAAELVSLTAHILDKDRKMHLSSARNAEGVGGVTVLNAERNVLKKLSIESGAKVT